MKRSKNTMKRSARVFLNDLNQDKVEELRAFLYLCHDVLQYFIDVFWARGEMTAKFADLETVHLATNRFGITTRLAQALAKQAMEIVASQRKKPTKERKKPALRRHVVTLFYHFLRLEEFQGEEFDFAAVFVGSGAPRLAAGEELHAKIQSFDKREKHTRQQIKEELAREIKEIDLAEVKTVVVEDLERVKDGKRGTFSRTMNRRLSHWQYAYAVDLLERRCEIEGAPLERKDPWKTSQHCPACGRWDKRNRRGDEFCCVFCGYSDHADLKAAKTLELLGLAGAYGLRSLPNLTFASVRT
jgi:IS605 OrfB family transposase